MISKKVKLQYPCLNLEKFVRAQAVSWEGISKKKEKETDLCLRSWRVPYFFSPEEMLLQKAAINGIRTPI
jgi:hypothetical protein